VKCQHVHGHVQIVCRTINQLDGYDITNKMVLNIDVSGMSMIMATFCQCYGRFSVTEKSGRVTVSTESKSSMSSCQNQIASMAV
jgi:hypothetical protein